MTVRKNITFHSQEGMCLEATLRIPEHGIRGCAIIIAGSGQVDRDGNAPSSAPPLYQKINLYRDIADTLAREGIATLTYDKRSMPHYLEE